MRRLRLHTGDALGNHNGEYNIVERDTWDYMYLMVAKESFRVRVKPESFGWGDLHMPESFGWGDFHMPENFPSDNEDLSWL